MKENKDRYYTPKFDKKYNEMVEKYGDPGFKKGKAYKLQNYSWYAGVSSLYLINEKGEEIAMDSNYVKEVKKKTTSKKKAKRSKKSKKRS